MPSIAEMLALGHSYQRSRDFTKLEQITRQILQADPGNVEALHLLGISFHARGRLAEAVAQYQQARHLDPNRVALANDLGTALAMQGRLDDAIAAFQEVVRLNPNFAQGHNNLGNALRLQGRLEEALVHFREAIRLEPNLADAHSNLALAFLAQDRPDQAIASSRQALLLNPNKAEALASLKKALQLNPNFPEAHNFLGNILAKAGQLNEAMAVYRQAIHLKPAFAEAHSNLANVHCRQGNLDEAIASFQQALHLKPDFADAVINLGGALKDQGRLDEAIACVQKARLIKPNEQIFHSNVLGTLHYHPGFDSRAILEEHRRWQQQHAQFPVPSTPFPNDISAERRLRIGYLSPDFSSHVVGRNIWPLLSNHYHRLFEIFLYANMTQGDAMTTRFQKCADSWCPVAHLSDDQVAERIRLDRIDILVDLALHTAGNRLLVFARKPTPVQVTFAGYPGTTGLSAIDYRLTDPYLDPPGLNDACYAEESYRLPHSFWCFDPGTEEPALASLPALDKGFVTFGCLNNFCKVNDGVLELWAKVLDAVPASRLLLLSKQGSHRQRTLDFLGGLGIAAGRVEFFSPRPRPEYLAIYHQIDIGLDTIPYNGHTTTLDSFWMGVPVISFVGKTVVGRAGLSQLTNLGLEELAATTPEDFVRLAIDLAGDLPRLELLRAGLRDRMRKSSLMDAPGFARGIEEAYRFMWRRWCKQQQG
jgi:predicted O-linked N-acetylglucosamine transferase (SPINDLY family)